GIRDKLVTGVQTCALPISGSRHPRLRSRKGLNLPGIDLGISAFTEKDRAALEFALGAGVDAVSQSFAGRAADIEAVRAAATKLRSAERRVGTDGRSGSGPD